MFPSKSLANTSLHAYESCALFTAQTDCTCVWLLRAPIRLHLKGSKCKNISCTLFHWNGPRCYCTVWSRADGCRCTWELPLKFIVSRGRFFLFTLNLEEEFLGVGCKETDLLGTMRTLSFADKCCDCESLLLSMWIKNMYVHGNISRRSDDRLRIASSLLRNDQLCLLWVVQHVVKVHKSFIGQYEAFRYGWNRKHR